MTSENTDTIFAVRRMKRDGFTDAITHPWVLPGVAIGTEWTTCANTSACVSSGAVEIYVPSSRGIQRFTTTHDALTAYAMELLKQAMNLRATSSEFLLEGGLQRDWRNYTVGMVGVDASPQHIGTLLVTGFADSNQMTPPRQEHSLPAGTVGATFNALGAGESTGSAAWAAPDFSERIRQLLNEVAVEAPERAVAARAVEEAAAFLGRGHLRHTNLNVSLTEDGFVSLKWRFLDQGVLVLFPGDGTANYSLKLAGGFYANGGRDFSLEEPAPAELLDVISNLEST